MRDDSRGRLRANVERVLALRSFPGLASVDPAHLSVLADIAVERIIPEGSTLIAPGQPAKAMHLIRRGRVAALHDGAAVRRYGPGEVVGAIATLSPHPTSQHVIAEAETRTFELERRALLDVLEDSFSLLHATLSGILRSTLQARLAIPENAGFSELTPEERPHSDLTLVERVLFVRRLLTYGHARVEALAELSREMRRVDFSPGSILWESGEAASYALLLWSGTVHCTTSNGQSFRFGPDSVVGGIDSIAGEPRWFRAVAETPVLALRSDTTHLFDVLEDHPDMGLDMLRAAARILAELNERVVHETVVRQGSSS